MINFKATNTEISDHLKDVTANKLENLDKFIGNAPAVCDVEFERITNHHQNGNINRVEINLELNGKLYRAEATAESFEKAIDEAKGDLYHELHSSQGKRETMVLRGARRMKEMMRFGW
jgi:ribosomal subunit interface protein